MYVIFDIDSGRRVRTSSHIPERMMLRGNRMKQIAPHLISSPVLCLNRQEVP